MSTGLSVGTSAYCNKTNRPEERQGQREQAGLKKACSDFESIFIGYMLKSMRSTVPQSGLSKGAGSDLYTSMFDREVAQRLSSKNGGIGIQKMLFKQIDGQSAPDNGK
jgi:flagellar protein FlgJ